MPMEKRGCVLEQRNAPSTTGHFLLGICPLIWFLRDQLSTQTWLSRVIFLLLSTLVYQGLQISVKWYVMDSSCVTLFPSPYSFFAYTVMQVRLGSIITSIIVFQTQITNICSRMASIHS